MKIVRRYLPRKFDSGAITISSTVYFTFPLEKYSYKLHFIFKYNFLLPFQGIFSCTLIYHNAY